MVTPNQITLGNASYGYREYGLREFFEATRSAGVTAVEIDCGWLEESQNKISVDATHKDISAVRQLAVEVGVNVVALGGGAVVGLRGDVVQDRCEEMMKVIDVV